jgi:glycosyltransferase involved in cell wall biosynthesis
MDKRIDTSPNAERTRQPLDVALVAPPWYAVPPGGYGGIELVIDLLATELAARGHQVTVLGREDSEGNFDVLELAPTDWVGQLGTRDQLARESLHVLRAYDAVRQQRPQVVHDHMGLLGLLLGASLDLSAPVISTMHGDLPEATCEFLAAVDRRTHLVAISDAQRDGAAGVRWAGIVHNAVDARELIVSAEKDDYLLQLARITPDKGQHVAIEVARRVGRPLVLAGKLEPAGQDYFEEQVRPHLDHRVRWIEDVAGREKSELLTRAAAMIFPLQWDEPFGLAMVEAMASGTPVVALRRGAAVELVEPGLTGFLADDVDELVDGVRRIGEIDPHACAERARDRFSAARMADGYEEVYRAALDGSGGS